MFGRMLHRQRRDDDLARPNHSLEAHSLEEAIQRALNGVQGVHYSARPAFPAAPEGGPGAAEGGFGAEHGSCRRASGDIWWYCLLWYHGCLPPEVLSTLLDEVSSPGGQSA